MRAAAAFGTLAPPADPGVGSEARETSVAEPESPRFPSVRRGWSSRPAPFLLATMAAGGLALLVATHSGADSAMPAAIAPVNSTEAERSFDRFARSWMEKMRRVEAENRRRLAASREEPLRYLGYGEDFETELRPTKHPATPYVGILRYTERQYVCADARARSCTISMTTPVTEIFRFQDGRWVY